MRVSKMQVDDITSTIFYSDWTNYDDLKFPAQAINPPGSVSDPDRDTNDGTLLFAASGTEVIMGIAQLPHAWAEGTDIFPHVHWQTTDNNAGDVLWRLEYDIANVDEDFAGSYTAMDIVASSETNSNGHLIKSFGAMPMGQKKLSCIIKWKLSRIGGDASDTYGSDAKLLEFDIHYAIDSVGSGLELQK
jgi:hypothetical protein